MLRGSEGQTTYTVLDAFRYAGGSIKVIQCPEDWVPGASIKKKKNAPRRRMPEGRSCFGVFYFISSYMTALMVCIRFSASSKTMDAGDSKTSSVTSMAP